MRDTGGGAAKGGLSAPHRLTAIPPEDIFGQKKPLRRKHLLS
ncbi:hypothetical protein [Paracoccus alkenifer]|nr:hypothetical protein [Paracoccus alkenifer]